jgi:hypothetical protein
MRPVLVLSFVLSILLLSPAGTARVSAQEPGASETTIVVTDEADYRAAVATLGADDSGPHTIRIGADFELEEGGPPIAYRGTQPLTIDGQGHTVRGPGTRTETNMIYSNRVLTVEDLTLRNMGTGLDSSSPIVVRRSAFTGIGRSAVRTEHRRAMVFVSRSTFRGNATFGSGGAISSLGPVLVSSSSLIANRAEQDGAAIWSLRDVRIVGSTIARNRSPIFGTISSEGGDVTLVNTTVTGNSVFDQDSTAGQGIVHARGRVTLDHATIAGNRSAYTGASAAGRSALDGHDLVSFNSVVQHPKRDCTFVETSSQGSRSSDTSCEFNGPRHGVLADPRLGPLADNGGPTLTRQPLAGSPLIDAVDCRPAVPKDQRGVRRPQGPRCDIGAVEVS